MPQQVSRHETDNNFANNYEYFADNTYLNSFHVREAYQRENMVATLLHEENRTGEYLAPNGFNS
jgi:hypothetical protein